MLQSASADRQRSSILLACPTQEALEAWDLIKPGWQALQEGDRLAAERHWLRAMTEAPDSLLLQRAVNQHAPSLLRQRSPIHAPPWGSRIAILLPGELRCLGSSLPFFESLSRTSDLFVCTSSAYSVVAKQLPGELLLVDREPDLPTAAMHQWHKLSLALGMVRAREQRTGRRYTHILKLRTDFHHVQPRCLLRELVAADGLVCASDKVFGGHRELMLLFEGFYGLIYGWFYQKEQHYWPISVSSILQSDDSVKWYGMSFPRQLVGQPSTVDELRHVLSRGGSNLAKALLQWQPDPGADSTQLYWRLFQGHPRFASEVCFARFLNFNSIPAHSCPGLLGFLRSDRLHHD